MARPATEESLVVAARAGDEGTFTKLVERYRRELHVHCYRMLGSLDDAEDAVQETLLRAWRYRASFSREGRWSYRAWLYRIATNACLNALAGRPHRVLPYDVAPPADPNAKPPSAADLPWLEPYPDRLLEELGSADPEPDTAAIGKETIELAFLAAIQHLPPRQRAALLLRDVLGWPMRDVAAALETTLAAANSALQRARGTLRQRLPRRRAEWARPDATERELAILRRYMEAQEHRDAAAVTALLREDVRVAFPPLPLWYAGRDAFRTASDKFAAPGDYRMVATAANGQPAIACYLRSPGDPEYRPLVIEVLRIEDGRVAEILDFGDKRLFAAFALPLTLQR